MEKKLVSALDEGAPQGGPPLPLTSNIVLDELDRELFDSIPLFIAYLNIMDNLPGLISPKLRLRLSVTENRLMSQLCFPLRPRTTFF